MNVRSGTRALLLFALVVGTLLPELSLAQHGGHGEHGGERQPRAETPTPPARSEVPAKPDRTIEIAVTPGGFAPNDVTVKRGQRVRLVLKRTTNDTCAKEFVLDEFLVWKRLPLNERVSDEFVTGRTGDFTFKCPSGAVSGTMHVVE